MEIRADVVQKLSSVHAIAVSQSGCVEKQFDALSDLRVSFAGDLHVVKNLVILEAPNFSLVHALLQNFFALGGAVVKNCLFDRHDGVSSSSDVACRA